MTARLAKDPAFPFYCRDWLASQSVTLMSLAAEATYVRLLCYQWLADDGLLPGDHVALRALTKCPAAEWRKVWPEIEPHFPIAEDGKRANPRLAEERRTRDAFRAEQRARSAKGNRVRWGSPDDRGGDVPGIAQGSQTGSQTGSPERPFALPFASALPDLPAQHSAREAVSRNETARDGDPRPRLTAHGARSLDAICRGHPQPGHLEAEVAAILDGMRPNVPTDPVVVSQALSDLCVAGGPVSARALRAFVQSAAKELAKASAPAAAGAQETGLAWLEAEERRLADLMAKEAP